MTTAIAAVMATLIAVSCSFGSRLEAQVATTVPRLTIDEVLQRALAASPRLLAERQDLLRSEGARLQAAAPFDPRLRSSISSARDNTLTANPGTSSASAYATVDELRYGVEAEKQFRSGVVLAPSLVVTQSELRGAGVQPTGTASAQLNLLVPLLNNRSGSVIAASERAAQLDYAGNEEDVRFTATVAVREVMTAYWSYRAAEERLAIFRESEQRARRLVDDTEVLVRADERPSSDTTQLSANLARQRAQRINAEQRVEEAREALGVATGVPGDSILGLAAPAAEFPVPDPQGDAAIDVGKLTVIALRQRADARAAMRKREAAGIVTAAGTKNLQPRLDLSFRVGYDGYAQRRGVDGFFLPLRRNISGANTAVQLIYELPVTNVLARGRAVQLGASFEQLRIAEQDVDRRIRSGVAVAVSALQRSNVSLAESQRARALFGQTVENEKIKFRLGMATLFDILNAEDALTNAMLAEVAGRQAFAVAILDLRFTTGTMLESSSRALIVRPVTVLTIPTP